MRLKKVILTVLLVSTGLRCASAQSQDIGRLAQPQRAEVRAEWEKISPGEILCVDNRLRRARRSVDTLIELGIGPTDNRVTGIVSDCRTDRDAESSNLSSKPSFNCHVATQSDEIVICATPELARLDRAVVEGYERMLGSDGRAAAQSVAEPLLRRRHACGPNVDCIKRVQLTAIAAFQERGAPVQISPPAPQVTVRDKVRYIVEGMQLGNNVGVGNPNYLDYTCAPAKQYAGFTGCVRQTAERSRRKRILESTSFLHAADGSVVYINQNLDPVVMDENDAHDEITRLSKTLGEAALLPTQNPRGVPSGLIASWGAVSLQPLEPARRAELAAGVDDEPVILIDTIGNVQKSAQLGLPVYSLGGGAGYVWSARWNGRGRGALRVLAIDASRLPGAVAEVTPSPDPAAIASAPTAPAVVTAAPTSSLLEAPKPAAATQPAPSVATQSAQKLVEPAQATGSQSKPPAAAAADVRVVGPPIEQHATAPAANPKPATVGPAGGNVLVIFLIALIILLMGAIGYLLRKSRVAPPAAFTGAPAGVIETPAQATRAEVPVAPNEVLMDLTSLVPAESPASVAGSAGVEKG